MLTDGIMQALSQILPEVEIFRDLFANAPEKVKQAVDQIVNPAFLNKLAGYLMKPAKQNMAQTAGQLTEDELDEMRLPKTNTNKKKLDNKKEIDELSSSGGGSVEGGGGNNLGKRDDEYLIREEELVEKIMHKLISGEY